MTIKKFAVLMWASLLATAAIAGEQHRTRIEIAVDDDSGPASLMFDSQSAGFDLHDMVVDDNRQIKKVKMIKTGDADAVTIITGAAIDESTRQRIREVLESAGQQGDIVFIDGSEFNIDNDKHARGRHEVRIIRKEVDVTN